MATNRSVRSFFFQLIKASSLLKRMCFPSKVYEHAPTGIKTKLFKLLFLFSELGCLSINIVSVMFVFSVHKTGAWTAWDQNWENGKLATLWYDYDKFVSNDAHLKFLQCIT